MIDTPSGRFPSTLERPGSSRHEGMLAEERALSFKAACLGNLPLLYLQLNPCLPMESTSWPQLQHWWGPHSGVPRRSLTSILIESSSRWRPKEESSRAFNQAPNSLREAANSRALSSQLWAPSNSLLDANSTPGLSQAFCQTALSPEGGWKSGTLLDHIGRTQDTTGERRGDREVGRMEWTREAVEWAEARKAEGVTSTALQTPRPPNLTGREAWSQAGLERVRGVLVILLRAATRTESKSIREFEAWSCPKKMQKFRNGKRRMKQGEGVMSRKDIETFTHRLKSGGLILNSWYVTQLTTPMGEPSKEAWDGSTVWAPGKQWVSSHEMMNYQWWSLIFECLEQGPVSLFPWQLLDPQWCYHMDLQLRYHPSIRWKGLVWAVDWGEKIVRQKSNGPKGSPCCTPSAEAIWLLPQKMLEEEESAERPRVNIGCKTARCLKHFVPTDGVKCVLGVQLHQSMIRRHWWKEIPCCVDCCLGTTLDTIPQLSRTEEVGHIINHKSAHNFTH